MSREVVSRDARGTRGVGIYLVDKRRIAFYGSVRVWEVQLVRAYRGVYLRGHQVHALLHILEEELTRTFGSKILSVGLRGSNTAVTVVTLGSVGVEDMLGFFGTLLDVCETKYVTAADLPVDKQSCCNVHGLEIGNLFTILEPLCTYCAAYFR